MLTTAHFHVIHIASALTSSIVTPGWKRMPPLDGPRAIECWTRCPTNTLTRLLSIRTGIETVSWRLGERRTSRMPASRPRWSAARSNCRWANSKGLRFSGEDGWAAALGLGSGDWAPRRAAAGEERRLAIRLSPFARRFAGNGLGSGTGQG